LSGAIPQVEINIVVVVIISLLMLSMNITAILIYSGRGLLDGFEIVGNWRF
jgi:hypothetical protein